MRGVVGIDAGGTKTHAILADLDGRLVGEARGPGANISTAGGAAVEAALRQVIAGAIGGRDVTLAAIGLGMAGADRPDDHEILDAIMRRVAPHVPVVIVNDALAALVAGAGLGPGLVVIAGTGSIAFGRDPNGRTARSGGWGYILADEGSGFWIGAQALRAVMRQWDGRGPATSLTPAVLAHLRLENPVRIGPSLYGGEVPVAAIASLAPLVGSAAADGDPVAAAILDHAAAELALAASSVARRLEMLDGPFPCVLAGGVFRMSSLVEAFSRAIRATAPGANVRRLQDPPALGAVRLALEEARRG